MRILIFLFTFLYASIPVYMDENVKIVLPKPYIAKPLHERKKSDFIALLSYNSLPIAIKNGWYIISGIGELKTNIISHKPITDIKTVANVNLPAKIFFKTNKNIKFVQGGIKEFEKGEVDAIVNNIKKYYKNVYYYDLADIGIVFNKYYLVADKKFLEQHKNDAEYLSAYFPKVKLNNSVFLTALYLNKKVNISSIYDKMFRNVITNKLKVVLTPSWPPFDLYNDGKLSGIGVDFFRLIAKKAHLDYEFLIEPIWLRVLIDIKTKKFDITPNTSETPDRKKYAIFSKPYVEFPFAIACRNDLKLNTLQDIKTLAVGYNYTAHKIMKKHYPQLNFVPAKNIIEAFKLVSQKKAQCVVDVLPVVLWMINQEHLGDMRIFFKTPFTFKLQVMIRKDLPEVRDKINQAIDNITVFEKNKIISKYIGEQLTQKDNKISYILTILILVVLIIIILYKIVRYKKRAELDGLTKIFNREAIENMLKHIIKEKSGSVIFLDIDHFKKINDTYGHEKGDQVLEKVTSTIKNNIRKNDIFGRWGGEEFVIILPETRYLSALMVAEKLRKLIEKSEFDGLKVTISLGVSSFNKHDNADDVINKADKAMYEAKRGGRNQVKGKK